MDHRSWSIHIRGGRSVDIWIAANNRASAESSGKNILVQSAGSTSSVGGYDPAQRKRRKFVLSSFLHGIDQGGWHAKAVSRLFQSKSGYLPMVSLSGSSPGFRC